MGSPELNRTEEESTTLKNARTAPIIRRDVKNQQSNKRVEHSGYSGIYKNHVLQQE
jgi:hypothetical protein